MFTRGILPWDGSRARVRGRREEPMSRKIAIAEVAGRSYWREAEARVMVKAWQGSGSRLSRFARRHGVDPRRLSRWASRLEGSELSTMRFHPVRLAERGGGGADGRAG